MRLAWVTMALGIGLAGCGSDGLQHDRATVLAFDLDWSQPELFDSAWRAARANPAGGVRFRFPVAADGILPGREVRLYLGRSTTEGSALETGSDVILADPFQVSTAQLDQQGRAELGPLAVTEGRIVSGTHTIPYRYLCGTTVIAARAFRPAQGAVPGEQFLAATWFHAVAEPCD